MDYLLINGIKSIKEEAGSGQYLRLYMGKSNCKKNIYVSKENRLKALELINNIKIQEKNLDTEINTSEDKNKKNSFKINTSKIVAIILIAMIIIPMSVTIGYQIVSLFR